MLTDKRKEKISAYLDDDMHRDELMSFSLSAEPADADTVRRYQMVGDVLRGEMSEASFVDVSQAVRKVLQDEATYDITPSARQAEQQTSAGAHKGWLSAWFRPVAGMAVAASVAVVVVMTVSDQDSSIDSPVAANIATPSAVQLAAEDKVKAADIEKARQSVDRRLVNQHLEYATQDTLQGRLPLVRSVSYEAEK